MGLRKRQCGNFARSGPDESSASKTTIYFAKACSNEMVGGVKIAVRRKTCTYIIW